jgi:ATP-dependent Clp protease ATP-binding subunit ClpB
VGYEEGGQLTEAVRRKPYSVILFDEIEKAHPDVFNVLLQLLDDGRLTDGKGRTVDFKNTVVIMTSNIGSHIILETRIKSTLGQAEDLEKMREQVMGELRSHFRPEFLNRIDDILFFEALSPSHLAKIVDIQMDYLVKRLAQRDITMELTEETKEFLANLGYDPIYGARPLRRVIRKFIENPLATKLLQGEFRDGDHIRIDVDPIHPNALMFSGVVQQEEATSVREHS